MPFLHSFEPGGVERVALRLAGAWAEAGCEVVIAMGRRGGALAVEQPPGVLFDFARPNPSAARYESLWLTPHLISAIRRHRPDVLFCAGNTYAVVAVLVRLLMGPACPPIVAKVSNSLDRRDFGPVMRRLYGLWLRIQARFIDLFVGMAETMRPEMAAGLGAAPSRLAIVHDPALSLGDIEALAAAEGRRRAPACAGRRFVGVGRLVRQKDFALAVRAFARLAGPEDRLILLGDGPERAALEGLAAALGVADRLELPGHVEDVAPWLAEADAFVLSSLYEGVPAALIEALAAGVAIAATDCSAAMTELLDAGALGRLTAPGDEAALAASMAAAAAEGASDAGAMRAMAERFTIERSGAAYLMLLRAAAASRAPAFSALPLAAAVE
jgi:glycosyltransferase involved in cell wall biosynthesis